MVTILVAWHVWGSVHPVLVVHDEGSYLVQAETYGRRVMQGRVLRPSDCARAVRGRRAVRAASGRLVRGWQQHTAPSMLSRARTSSGPGSPLSRDHTALSLFTARHLGDVDRAERAREGRARDLVAKHGAAGGVAALLLLLFLLRPGRADTIRIRRDRTAAGATRRTSRRASRSYRSRGRSCSFDTCRGTTSIGA